MYFIELGVKAITEEHVLSSSLNVTISSALFATLQLSSCSILTETVTAESVPLDMEFRYISGAASEER
jgi:hypothetical protein